MNAKSANLGLPETVGSMKKSGFTLIELLVAISVLAIVAVLGWRGLDTIVRARIALTSQLEQTRGMQLAFAQMQYDFSHLASTALLQNRVPLVVSPGRVELVRTVKTDDQPTRLQVVTYYLKDGILARKESVMTRDLNALLNMQIEMSTDNDLTQAVVLVSGVTDIKVREWVTGGIGWRIPGVDITRPTSSLLVGTIATTGLEISLQLQKYPDGAMTKIFMLGPV